MISVFERAKTVHALGRAATVISKRRYTSYKLTLLQNNQQRNYGLWDVVVCSLRDAITPNYTVSRTRRLYTRP
jgi:hypothetical protein